MSGEQFLHKKHSEFHTSEPVEHEEERRKRAGEKRSPKPAEKISSFLKVIDRTHGHHDDPRVLERVKKYYHKEYASIKADDIPQSYWDSQGEILYKEGRSKLLTDQGIGIKPVEVEDVTGKKIIKREYKYPAEIKEQYAEIIRNNQARSLDKWVDYLASDDVTYPTWAKYWTFQSIVKMGKFEKLDDSEKGKSRGARFAKSFLTMIFGSYCRLKISLEYMLNY